LFGQSVEDANELVFAGDDQIGAQVIVQVAGSDDASCRPVGSQVGSQERTASLLDQEQRRLPFARDE